MATFSISDIEKFTGIKAHTLRIWEQRYQLLTPKRTDTNIRYYDDQDLRTLLNVSILIEGGYKISHISALEVCDMEKKALEISQKEDEYPTQIKALCSAMLAVDENAFNKIITTNILQLGLEGTMSKIIFPFLSHIGILWMTGAIHPAHEHFITNLIRQKLFVAIDGQSNPSATDAARFLLYLPEGETHEIGLLFANYILRSRGHHVVYLGQMTPEEDIITVFDFYRPQYIFTSATSSLEFSKDIKSFIEHTSKLWCDAEVFITGSQVVCYQGELPTNVHIVKDLDSFCGLLENIKPKNLQASL